MFTSCGKLAPVKPKHGFRAMGDFLLRPNPDHARLRELTGTKSSAGLRLGHPEGRVPETAYDGQRQTGHGRVIRNVVPVPVFIFQRP